MDVDVGEGNAHDLLQSSNVPPLNLGVLAVGTQNERENERKTSFENQDGQLVAVHPLASPGDPTVVIPLLETPFSSNVGLGTSMQDAAETLEQLYARYHPPASALLALVRVRAQKM